MRSEFAKKTLEFVNKKSDNIEYARMKIEDGIIRYVLRLGCTNLSVSLPTNF